MKAIFLCTSISTPYLFRGMNETRPHVQLLSLNNASTLPPQKEIQPTNCSHKLLEPRSPRPAVLSLYFAGMDLKDESLEHAYQAVFNHWFFFPLEARRSLSETPVWCPYFVDRSRGSEKCRKWSKVIQPERNISDVEPRPSASVPSSARNPPYKIRWFDLGLPVNAQVGLLWQV